MNSCRLEYLLFLGLICITGLSLISPIPEDRKRKHDPGNFKCVKEASDDLCLFDKFTALLHELLFLVQMKLEELGYNKTLEKFRTDNNLTGFDTGRIVAEHKERYVVLTELGYFDAEITGNMRFTAKSRSDFPAVGDWVAVATFNSDFAVIHKIHPRSSVIKRQAAGQYVDIQIIATNIDYAFIVQALDRDFNINRIERFLTICNSSGIRPIIILTKTDLLDMQQITEITADLKVRIKNVPVIAISNTTLEGFDNLKNIIRKGKTYCLLGSSGAGKSSILNNLSGRINMRTDAISSSTGKGKHVTSHRELFVLENGGILIDNPGMREVGITDDGIGLEKTFDLIVTLATKCRFKDCSHTNETGCHVIEAVENGELARASYENYLKMLKEKVYFDTTAAEKKRKERIFGKIIKNYKKSYGKDLQ